MNTVKGLVLGHGGHLIVTIDTSDKSFELDVVDYGAGKTKFTVEDLEDTIQAIQTVFESRPDSRFRAVV